MTFSGLLSQMLKYLKLQENWGFQPGPGYKAFFMLSSAELKFILLINVKMKIVGILTFMSRINY